MVLSMVGVARKRADLKGSERDDPYTLSVPQAARLLGVSETTLNRRRVKDGSRTVGWTITVDGVDVVIPAVVIGSRPRVPRHQLQQALGANQ